MLPWYNKNKEQLTGYLFILPNMLGLICLTFIPILFSAFLSFTEWNFLGGFKALKWIGLDNYFAMFEDPWFLKSLRNNFIYVAITVPLIMLFALPIALILNSKVYWKNLIRMMIFMPYVSSAVIVAVVWGLLYRPSEGLINSFLRDLGLVNPPGWIASTTWALPAVIIIGVWGLIGYTMILYLAGLQGIPRDLYEAAEVDGANSMKKLLYITVPMLRPTTFFIMVTLIITTFQVFGTIFMLTQGGPAGSTSMLAYYIYITAFNFHKFGYSSAMSWFLFLMLFIVTFFQWRQQKKWANDF
ncbi:sugar ABC transporter permease [Cohnella sp. CIP 111063]|uniref:carbohydrate ABC transporter permease n=1 Tax=unclassified Cohnella TaxID=2636738 RepID=UPI000B8BEB7C|nr:MULTISPECIES: sugar ABC transporter permease [unclassified Cohnella]OXS60312.1 sugar ABC transporter permease [Cohnella sp. CIP 111063]PRX72998.1 carbohydrate ABC transporter membrane protein 1 (CUT1 family) [Cohnella sp. SGD-V74]